MYAEFDAERRAFSKLELKRVRQQQAQDRVEPELAAKIEAREASLAGEQCGTKCHMATLPYCLLGLIFCAHCLIHVTMKCVGMQLSDRSTVYMKMRSTRL